MACVTRVSLGAWANKRHWSRYFGEQGKMRGIGYSITADVALEPTMSRACTEGQERLSIWGCFWLYTGAPGGVRDVVIICSSRFEPAHGI